MMTHQSRTVAEMIFVASIFPYEISLVESFLLPPPHILLNSPIWIHCNLMMANIPSVEGAGST